MWTLWNKAIIVNTLRAKVDNLINQTCPLCDNEKEPHCTNFGNVAMWAWEYTQSIVCELAYGNKPSWVVAPPHWKQCVFATKSLRQTHAWKTYDRC
jgi:hypothetical protein